MNTIKLDKTIESEIGMFAVIDPCYLLAEEIYHGQWGDKHGFEEGVFEFENGDAKAECFIGWTAYGDGSYYGWGSQGISMPRGGFGVDSGTIACIPAELWPDTSDKTKEEILTLGTIINASTLRCEVEDGNFVFTDNTQDRGVTLLIQTSDDDEDEDECEEEYEEYDEEGDDDE